MRLVDDRIELLVGELEQVVTTHDLDQVCTAADLLAHSRPHLVGT